MADIQKLLTTRYDLRDGHTIRVAEENGAYATARRAFTTMRPEDLCATVKDANMRGRGGAGFPTGVKWGFLPKGNTKPVYLVINADEEAFFKRHADANAADPGPVHARVSDQVPALVGDCNVHGLAYFRRFLLSCGDEGFRFVKCDHESLPQMI